MRYVGGGACFLLGIEYGPFIERAVHPRMTLIFGIGMSILVMFAASLWDRKKDDES